MTILTGDLVIVKSEIMNDSDEGGGYATEHVIVDGQSNNIFPDISTLERTYGGVRAAKAHVRVKTQNDDAFFGSHVAIVKLPGDTQIGINLFSTGDHYDRRLDAAKRIENYRGQGGKYPAYLWGRQYAGTQVLTVFQAESVSIPTAGDVLVLLKLVNAQEQYVRINNVSHTMQSFTDANGTFVRRVVNFEISSPLEQDFEGIEVARLDTITPPTSIYKTTVANAARYYSARRLKTAAALGDYVVTADSVYSQVVPSSQSQTPLIDLSAGSNAAPLINLSDGTLETSDLGDVQTVYLGRACIPGSLTLVGALYNQFTDSGGYLYNATQEKVAIVDYAAGVISFFNLIRIINAIYRPAVSPLIVANTESILVTDNNRSFVYTFNINPPPEPGALQVSFMAMNTWYDLRDNGSGALFAQTDGIGSGTVSYLTGSGSITLSALPDVGSEIVFASGNKVDYTNRAVDSGGNAIAFSHTIVKQLTHSFVVASSLVISWIGDNANATHQLNCSAAGVLTGHGTGSFVSSTGVVSFTPNDLVAVGTVFSFDYVYGTDATGGGVVTKSLSSFNMVGQSVELNLGDTDIVAGSLVVEWAIPWGSSLPLNVLANDYANLPNPASGTAQQADRDNATGSFVGGRSAVVDYAAGIVSFTWAVTVPLRFALFSKSSANTGNLGNSISAIFRGYLGGAADLANPTSFMVHYRLASGAATNNGHDTLELLQITLDMTPSNNEPLVPNSVMFNFSNRLYVDRSGQLYYNVNHATGAGTFGGTINYSTGVCTLPSWQSYFPNPVCTLLAAMTTSNFNPVDVVVFRTAIAPIKPSSFSIRATTLTGALITATANEAGVISTSDMVGSINHDTGVVKVRFGQLVTAAGNEGQPWYNPDAVIGGQIFKSKPVIPSTIAYNAVSFTFIPLDKDILRLDSVRLPVDGRIPIYRKGDVVVVLHDQTTSGTFASSATVNLGRVRLAKVTVRDLGGNLLAANKWSVNLDTGVVTFGDLAGVSQPLKIVDRIEDMAVVADVQITGKIKLSKPLTHAYPATDTLISNAVVLGDLYAHTSTPFDQQTWTNVWSDILIGNNTTAQFNSNLYPITVTNSGSIEERWLALFNTSGLVNIIGEHVGQIVTGASIASDIAPINPATGDPYFFLDHRAFGAGWSGGNALRFNTYVAGAPVWIIQSIGQGEPTSSDYGFCIEFRGDVDAP